MTRVEDLTATALYGYIRFLEKKQRKAATISRNIASIRAFCHYLVREGVLMMDVSETLKAPQGGKEAARRAESGRGGTTDGCGAGNESEGASGQSNAGAFVCNRVSGYRS